VGIIVYGIGVRLQKKGKGKGKKTKKIVGRAWGWVGFWGFGVWGLGERVLLGSGRVGEEGNMSVINN
jgi:hypothetical protein